MPIARRDFTIFCDTLHARLMDILTAEINELRPLLLRMLRDADGFAFSQEEGGSVTQTDVIRAYDTNLPKPGGM